MEIVVCIKQVPDPKTIEVNPFNGHLECHRIINIINPPDICAVEEALRIREKLGGRVTVLCIGSEHVDECLRKCLSMGVDGVLRIWEYDWLEETNSTIIAFALKKYIDRIKFDLVLFGDEVDCSSAPIVPAWVAEYLNIPLVTSVIGLKVKPEEKKVVLKRKLEKGKRQLIESAYPVVIAVDASINEPRESSLPAIIQSLRADIPVAQLTIGSIKRMLPKELWTLNLFEEQPYKPVSQLIVAPSASSGFERIYELVSGEKGLFFKGSPEALADKVIDNFVEQGIIIKK